jgi:CRISPR-associated exonuclease Cas4
MDLRHTMGCLNSITIIKTELILRKPFNIVSGSGTNLPNMEEQIIHKVRDKLKVGVDNYRAASDAPAKVDVYDVIEEVFADLNPGIGDESNISINEASGCLRHAYLDRKQPAEHTHKQMITALMEKGAMSVLEKPVEGSIEAGSNVKLIGRADRVEEDVVMIFRRVHALPETPYAQHFIQLNAYLYMFGKEEGVIVYFDSEGNEAEFQLPKSDKLFRETQRRARILTTLLKSNIVPTIEPSPRCNDCPHNEKCYYQSEDKQKWGLWARGKWRELKPKPFL